MLRRGANPDIDVLLGRRDDRGPRNRDAELARKFGDGRDLREGQHLADTRPGFALQLLKFGIRADEPAGGIDAAGNPPLIE